MLRKYVTAMNREIYDQYGENMLRTFSLYWPRGEMVVYTEEGELPLKDERIKYRLIYEIPGLAYFLEGIQHFPVFSGLIGEEKNYRFNINAYARKAYAEMDAAQGFNGNLYWIDADVVTTKHIPGAMLDEFLRGNFICCMKRKTWHMCSSFVGWDCGHAFAQGWFEHYRACYQNGYVFMQDQWDDAFILEQTLNNFPAVNDLGKDITGEGPYNVFDSVFEGYAYHMKGPMKQKWSNEAA